MTDSETVLAALGPLASLYTDPAVREILVDSPERVFVDREGRLEDAGVKFSSPGSIQTVVDALLGLNEELADPGETIIPIHFPGSEACGMAVLSPTAIHGPCLVIRKLMNTGFLSWDKLIEFGSITQEAVDFLRRAVRVPVNILMAGGAAGGKLVVATRIAEMIPSEERLVIVENTHELQIQHPRMVYLEAAGQPGVSMQRLIQTGAMMRPDWLVISELEGAEAMQAVEVFGRGYNGLTTIHANSVEDALTRLEMMCLTANMGLGLVSIRNLIAAGIQLVCYLKRLPDGKRRIVEITEVHGVENGQLLLEPLFRYDSENDRLEATGIKASWE